MFPLLLLIAQAAAQICIVTTRDNQTDVGGCHQRYGYSVCEGVRYIDANSNCTGSEPCSVRYSQPRHYVGRCVWKTVDGRRRRACKKGTRLDYKADCNHQLKFRAARANASSNWRRAEDSSEVTVHSLP